MKKAGILVLFFAMTVSAAAQQPQDDPIGRNLFPPELVMNHQNEIGLSEEQRTAIRSLLQTAQSNFVGVQWRLQDETEKMTSMLRQRPIDESKVLAQSDIVMSLEREIKRTHLSLLIRIKNLLTEEQQSKLSAMRGR